MSDSLASLGAAELCKVIGFAKLFNGQKSMSSDFALMQITMLMHWGPPVLTGIACSCQVLHALRPNGQVHFLLLRTVVDSCVGVKIPHI